MRQGETLTGWAGQYDPVTLAPMGGRSFELPGIVSQETVAIVKYLMSIKDPSPEAIASVTAAATWLSAVKIDGMRLETVELDAETAYDFHSDVICQRPVSGRDRAMPSFPDASRA